MIKKLSGADKRLLGAILAVFLLFVASDATDSCDCDISKISVTFVDGFSKAQTIGFGFVNLPNAVVIVTNTKNKKEGFKTQKITLKTGNSQTISLEGQSVYAYTIFELEWDMSEINKLSTAQVLGKIATGAFEQYTTATRCIATGVILDSTTITF